MPPLYTRLLMMMMTAIIIIIRYTVGNFRKTCANKQSLGASCQLFAGFERVISFLLDPFVESFRTRVSKCSVYHTVMDCASRTRAGGKVVLWERTDWLRNKAEPSVAVNNNATPQFCAAASALVYY